MEFGFILKKVLGTMLMPLSIGLFLAFIGLIFLYKNKILKAKVFLTLSFVWIALISYSPVSNALVKPLEADIVSLQEIPKGIQYIVLLGGDKENRAWEVLRLYQSMEDPKIITLGYAGGGKIPGAIQTTNLLVSVGIPKEDIMVFSQPKDTKEEALQIKEFLQQEPFILVSSAFHLPRAMALFKGQGLNPIASSGHYVSKESTKVIVFPNADSLKKSETAFHEYLGILWSKLRGYI